MTDDLLRVGGTEDIGAADKHVDTRLYQARSRLALHAAIYLNQRLTAFLVNHPTQALHLVDGILDELLSAEAGIDTHEQHHVNITKDILQHTNGC